MATKEEMTVSDHVHAYLLNNSHFTPVVRVEQYWNDVERVTREQCDYTISGLKVAFPISPHTACPPAQIRKNMRHSFEHVMVLNEIARTGSFDLTPSLKKKYKGHRESLRVKMGTASDSKTRARSSLGVGGEALSSCGACTRWMWPAWTSTRPRCPNSN